MGPGESQIPGDRGAHPRPSPVQIFIEDLPRSARPAQTMSFYECEEAGARSEFQGILQHTLDFEYVMQHWHPDVVAVQMAMPDQQETEVLEYLEKARFPGRLLMTGDVKVNALEGAAKVARENGLTVASVLTKSSPNDQIEGALKLLLDLERAA
jgi:hypothetical protein